MSKRAVFSLVIAAIAVALAGCDKLNSLIPGLPGSSSKTQPFAVAAVKGTLVAKINNIPVTLENLNQEIDSYNAVVPADRQDLKVTTREQKLNYLKNEVVRRLLLYQEASKRGLENNPDVAKALEKTKIDLLVMQLVREEAKDATVTSKEVEDYYNTYKDKDVLKMPEERQIGEIVIATEQDANAILIQLLQGADFAAVAKERSIAPSASKGGDLGFIQKGKKFPQFDEVAFVPSLEVGKLSNVVKGPDGYYILKLEAKRGGEQKPLSEMWDDIKSGLTFLKQQKKIEDLIGKLSRDAKVEIREEEIK